MDVPVISVQELDARLLASIEASEREIEEFKERLAMQCVPLDDGLTTTQRALAALERPARFNGEHDVAMAWLKTYDSHAGTFRKRLGGR